MKARIVINNCSESGKMLISGKGNMDKPYCIKVYTCDGTNIFARNKSGHIRRFSSFSAAFIAAVKDGYQVKV